MEWLLVLCHIMCFVMRLIFSLFSYAFLLSLVNKKIINIAQMYISSHGLAFSPSKTECVIFGKCYFKSRPLWYTDGVSLSEHDYINYLGITLSHAKPNLHIYIYRVPSVQLLLCTKLYENGKFCTKLVTKWSFFRYILYKSDFCTNCKHKINILKTEFIFTHKV